MNTDIGGGIDWLAELEFDFAFDVDAPCDGGCGAHCDICGDSGFCLRCWNDALGVNEVNPDCICDGSGACVACGCGAHPPIHIADADGEYECRRKVDGGDVWIELSDMKRNMRFHMKTIARGLYCYDCVNKAIIERM